MLKEKRNGQKIIAILLVFCFVFTNCFTLISNISFAETGELGKQYSNGSVEFDASFVQEDENKGYEFEGAIDTNNISIQTNIELKKSGYLKNARVLIESENGLSFNIEEISGEKYKINDNQIELSNISSGDSLSILIPITYKQRDDINNLNKKISMKLIGTYVDDSGNETGVSEEVVLRLIWNTNTEFNVTSNLTKYIPYSSENKTGAIIQTQINSGIPADNNFVEKEELEIQAIQIDSYNLENVYVTSKTDENFSANNWNYDKENNQINIKLENSEESIKSEEFLITYVFSGENNLELPFKITSKINGTISMFGTDETKSVEVENEYEITEQIGEIVTVEGKESETLEIGKLIANTINEEKQYKISYSQELLVDISSIDMVEGILISDSGESFKSEEQTYETKTSYYSSIKISKESFEEILGTEGKVEILDENSNILYTINNNTSTDDGNNYVINFENKVNKIKIKTSSPIAEGILTLTLNKEMIDSEYSAEQLKTFSKLVLKYTGSIIYSGNVENKVSDVINEIELVKPTTDVTFSMSRTTLSTITENKDITMTIGLNNNSEEIDLYKNPVFEITFPEYVEDLEITNISIANSEDVFIVSEGEIYTNESGNLVLYVKLDGTQIAYNSNNIANGTNIIMNANITLNLYAPSKEEKIEMRYINEFATSYKTATDEGVGYTEIAVEYKAPTGLVSINKTSGYDDDESTLVSVEQGTLTDKIEIFDEAKTATMDILVMNNQDNSCQNVKILGRTPFEGNKDLQTGENLGTTLDSDLVSEIIASDDNQTDSIIYYSENGEATEDLEDETNGWTTEIENLSEVKSYLIVTNNYEMQPGDVLKYSYQYEIPENLEHNESIYGTFETIYENVTDVATTEEISVADIVGLTTGVGPQMDVTTTTNVEGTAKEYEKVKYTISIKNTGEETIENTIVTTQIPEGATLAIQSTQSAVEGTKGWSLKADREVVTTIEAIEPGEIKEVEFYVQVNKLPTIEEYYANTEGFTQNEDGSYSIYEYYTDENGETQYNIIDITEIPEVKLVCSSSITAKDLAKAIETSDDGIVVEKSNLVAEETISSEEDIAKVGETIESKISIKNNSNETMNNIVVTKVLPEGLEYVESYIRGYESDGITAKKITTSTYDSRTRTITWTIDSLDSGRTVILIGDFIVGEMKDNIYEDTISTISNIEVNGESYQAGQVDIVIGRPYLTIEQTSDQINQYIKVGDQIKYIFNVKNIGSVRATEVNFVDTLPDEVTIQSLTYTVDEVEVSKVVSQNDDATVYTSILPDSEMEVTITAIVGDIETKEKTIENVAEINGTNVESIKSNEITNIIERTSTSVGDSSTQTNNSTTNENENLSSNGGNLKTTYEITGTAWLDSNKDGSMDSTEGKLSGIEVKLINATSGEQIDKTTTNQDGVYEFTNLSNGEYIAIFYYDTSKYALTDYKKQDVSEDKNSDVITATEDGTTVATTDTITINNGSKSYIDIGLIEATTFDLSLTKRITKVTVQTTNGTTSYDFDNTDLAKVDINSKYLSGAKVYVEYTFTITNEGELEGYVKKLVDYMPDELEFSTDLNSNWYEGTDGNLYTEQLADTSISAGESKTVTLVLTKNMTETNTGIINNQAEIAEDYNKAGIADIDSDPNDQDQKDDDISSADLIIGVKTGETLIYFSVIVTLIIAGLITVFAIKKSKLWLRIQLKIGKGV